MKAAALALLVVLAGCVGQCTEPMKEIGGRCCLDGNSNNVCDEDEPGYGDPAECGLPYIYYNGSCCLDSNGNRVCDRLESDIRVQVTTTTSSTTTSTSTTLVSTSSTTTTTTSTTTSTAAYVINVVTSTTIPVCADTDGGENYDVYGTVRGKSRAPPYENVSRADFCVSNRTLIEYRCQNEKVYSREYVCGIGYVCDGGRCCLPEGARCKASDECCSNSCRKKLSVGLCY